MAPPQLSEGGAISKDALAIHAYTPLCLRVHPVHKLPLCRRLLLLLRPSQLQPTLHRIVPTAVAVAVVPTPDEEGWDQQYRV
jgi:hypothetical protein